MPVFRYALERWPADAYEVVVFHREPLSTNQEALVEAWSGAGEKGGANLAVEKVNVSAEMPAPRQALWKAQTNATLPWVVILYPPAKDIELPVWAGPLQAEMLKTLAASPARRELSRKLCQGDSTVWLLVEGGNKSSNETIARLLENESKRLEKILKLPETDPDGPQVQAELPLKIAFSTVRVSRANPAEQMLVNMLLNIDKELAGITEPMVFAVFGRGRALPLLPGKELTPQIISEVAEFLTGACSCEVKSMNPGFDLLLAADWDGSLEGRVVKDPELPPLIGMAQFAAAVTNQPVLSPARTNSAVAMASDAHGRLFRNLQWTLFLGLAVLALGTVVIIKVKGRKS